MKDEFVPYKLALAMKELGFNQTCYAYYSTHHNVPTFHSYYPSGLDNESKWNDDVTIAPLYQQAFRWFREKYKLLSEIGLRDREDLSTWNFEITTIGKYEIKHKSTNYNTYEEAELACLEKLIEIVEEKNKES